MFYILERLQTAIVSKLMMFYRIWKGMSAIEWLVVFAIIMVMVGILIPAQNSGCGRLSNEQVTRINLNNITIIAGVYRGQFGHWPTQSEILSYTASDPYFSFDDAWNRPVIYTLLANGVQVHSLGRDPKDPADDIFKTVMESP